MVAVTEDAVKRYGGSTAPTMPWPMEAQIIGKMVALQWKVTVSKWPPARLRYPKRKRSSSKHPFLGSMLVSFTEGNMAIAGKLSFF